MARLRIALGISSIVVLLGGEAFAQKPGASVDLAVLTLQYADSVNAKAIALTPALWLETGLVSFSASATISEFTTGDWSSQGGLDGSVFTPHRGLLFGEIEGTTGGSAHRDGSRTGQLLGTARAHFARTDRGVWIGGGVGGTWDGTAWRNVRQGEAAAWTRFSAATAFASITPVHVNDSIRYTDAQLAGGVNMRRVAIDASGGFRSGNNLPTLGGTSKSWGSATVTGWITRRVAVVASAGTYPVDLTQDFPGGRFASLSVRFGDRRFLPVASSVPQPGEIRFPIRYPRESVFELREAGSSSRELRMKAPTAHLVEIMGDFTDWTPRQMSRSTGGWWTLTVPIEAGIHEVNVRIDGGSWIVPLGLPRKSDEAGGSVGLLIIR